MYKYQAETGRLLNRHRARIELKLAGCDPLTGLPNRHLFEEKLRECLGSASASHQLAILIIDLDNFREANQNFGYTAGDAALCELARRVSVILRADAFLAGLTEEVVGDAFLARVGGDEFGIILPGTGSLKDLTRLAKRIAAAAAEPFNLENAIAELGVGIGIAMAQNDGTQLDELVRRADRALNRAKAAGRSCVRFFVPETDTHDDEDIQIERELLNTHSSNSIMPHFEAPEVTYR